MHEVDTTCNAICVRVPTVLHPFISQLFYVGRDKREDFTVKLCLNDLNTKPQFMCNFYSTRGDNVRLN